MDDYLEKYPREPVNFRECKYILAPMVDFSELPFRLLCRHYGAHLCYTPMINSGQFVKSALYRIQEMQTCAADQPLIVQFCANEAATFATAAQYVAPFCDAVDLNLGCPQQVARRGHYGAFLTEWETIDDLIRTARRNANVPITCKIRLQSTVEQTIEYARMLVRSGVSAIALHGRTRDQIRDRAGAADWCAVQQVVQAVGHEVPFYANGSIRTRSDADKCIEQTGANGVLIAESALHNPALFAGDSCKPAYEIASEYLDAVAAIWNVEREQESETKVKATSETESAAEDESSGFMAKWKVKRKWNWSLNNVRGHLFKVLHLVCGVDTRVRDLISRARTFSDFREAVRCARERCEQDMHMFANGALAEANADPNFFPYWTSRSYFLPDEPLPSYVRLAQNKHLKAELSALQQAFAASNLNNVPDYDGILDIVAAESDSESKPAVLTTAFAAAGESASVDSLLQNAADASKRKAEKVQRRRQRALEKAARVPRLVVDCVECLKPRSDSCANQRCRKCCHRFVCEFDKLETSQTQECVGHSPAGHCSSEEISCQDSTGSAVLPNCEVHRHFVNAHRVAVNGIRKDSQQISVNS